MGGRRFIPALLAAGVLATAGCADDGEPEPEALGEDELVAVCLTDSAPEGKASDLATDLCTLDLKGQRQTIRPGVDPAVSIALSPDRTRVAFVEDGRLHLVAVDGSAEEDLELLCTAPEWTSDGSVACVTAEGRGITEVDVETGQEQVLVRSDQLPVDGAWVIESFARHPTTGRVVGALLDDRTTPDDKADDRFQVVLIDGADPATVVLAPSDRPFTNPDFAPDGRLVVASDYGLELVDVDGGGTRSPLSTPGRLATTPVWSADGQRVVWVGNGIAGPEGTARLMVADVEGDELGEPRIVIGDRNEPLDRFPAFPDW